MEKQEVLGIHLPASDTHFPDMIRRGPLIGGKGTYQLNKLVAALPFVKAPMIAFDIGAHVGLWSRVLATHFEWVHAFEMLPHHVECLRLNCGELKNVIIHGGAAIGSGDGVVEVDINLENTGNTCVRRRQCGALVETLPVHALDSYLPEGARVDFMKIDVEGFEMQVVIGATSTIKRCKPVMIVEQKPGNAERYGNRTGEVIDLLKAWGASIVWCKSGDYCLRWG